ncbi:hypothetical protein M622_13580 [Thauera terpenica 58Eu]|uniref:EAL domain-containing protein n=1 Tax=Thauera terpenica 58Eu TaxID=1348657 RepID=T0ATT8_9RHOO|nr:EAL domain-containing protein [Thauera terpenica]EPZ16254.1 hypothetical protein M622_13580 [Thauera terpenica 58Eu]
MKDPIAALEAIKRIKDLGVELFIDDFGIGHSSLSYLHRLPVNALKIDQSFVRSLSADAVSVSIVQSIIELGHRLTLEVVAEGVETEETCDQLAGLGCDTIQGYYVARPMPAERFGDWQLQYEAGRGAAPH